MKYIYRGAFSNTKIVIQTIDTAHKIISQKNHFGIIEMFNYHFINHNFAMGVNRIICGPINAIYICKNGFCYKYNLPCSILMSEII